MVHKVNIQITTPYLLTNPTTRVVASGATITCSVYDEADNVHASGNMTEVGATGLYYYNWTPNAIGVWKVVISCGSPVSNHSFIYHIGGGIEADTYGAVDTEVAAIKAKTDTINWVDITNLNTALTTHDTAIKNLIGTPALANMSADIASIWALLLHGSYGLSALKTEIDANETDIDANETKIDTLITNLATHDNDIKSLLNDATYGLSALETLVDEVESLLKHGTYGLAALDTELGTILTESQSHPTLAEIEAGNMSLIKTETDKISTLLTESQSHPTLAEIEATSVLALEATLGTHDTDIKAILNHATYGLSAIEALVDDLESRLTSTRAGYLDELDFDLDARLGTPTTSIAADIADLISRTKGLDDIHDDLVVKCVPIDCWSDEQAVVTITGGSTDVNLPSVIIPTLPTGATIWKVVLLFKCDLIKDTSGSDNAINGASAIRVKKSTGTWGVDDIVAYDIQDNLWGVDVSEATERGGDAFVGNLNNDNLSGEVDAAATYNLRFEDIQADGGNLELHSVAVGLRVYIY